MQMQTADVLEVVRQKIGQSIQEIGGEAPSYGDDFLLKVVKTINFNLIVLGIATGVSVDTNANMLIPDSASVAIGMLLASGAAASLIRDDVLSRLRRGELGLSFSTGATTISTNQASINLQTSADKLDDWHKLLLSAYLSGDPNSVIQRADSYGFNLFREDNNT